MSACPHCESAVAPQAAYCPACGRSRILDSLLAPRSRPAWQVYLWNGIGALAVVLFLVNTSVAFLREAKAVRVARQTLASTRPDAAVIAGEILGAFLAEEPDHEEARYLAAVAAVRRSDLAATGIHRDRLAERAPERLEALDGEIGQAIDAAFAERRCDASSLLSYHDAAWVLGEVHEARVAANLRTSARRCQEAGSTQQADALIQGMVERGAGDELIHEIFLRPLASAVAAGRWAQAWSLAQGASRVSVQARVAADQQLATVRDKVEETFRRMDTTCTSVRTLPEHRVGRFWCFPEGTPPSVRGTSDGWGRPLRYRPLDLDTNLQCFRGFEISSLGADGRETASPLGDPDDDMICRFVGGRQEWFGPWSWRSPS
jgi:hypothetical protein